MGNSYTQQFSLMGDAATAHTQVEEAMRRTCSAAGTDPQTGFIQGKISMSLLSYGENITVRMLGSQNNATTFQITSRLKFGLVDWGKNKKNVNNILHKLQPLSAHPT